MPAKILIAAQDLPSGYAKGDIVSVLPDGGEFGNKEALPSFIRLTVSDATKQEADAYLSHWGKIFDYEILAENAQGYRIRVSVDSAAISATGGGAELRQQLKDGILSGLKLGWTVQLHDQTANSITVDVAKPANLAEGKAALNERFSEIAAKSRYYFAAADVDKAIAAGGEFTRTRSQVTALLQDKLDD